MSKDETLAHKLHTAHKVIEDVHEIIYQAFLKHGEDEMGRCLECHFTSDTYDNSIEIYINNSTPVDYQPSHAVRAEIYKIGFDTVYWHFLNDEGTYYIREIRDYEPMKITEVKKC